MKFHTCWKSIGGTVHPTRDLYILNGRTYTPNEAFSVFGEDDDDDHMEWTLASMSGSAG